MIGGLIAIDGSGLALAAFGVGLVLAAALVAPAAVGTAAEAPALNSHPLFARLALPSLEELARELAIHRVDEGTEVVRQGEAGEDFYLIAEGEFEVAVDGQPVRYLSPGEGFGEIALLRDVPRTASVTARTSATVYALGRRAFLGAMGTRPPRVSLPGHEALDDARGADAQPEPSGTVPA